MHALLEILPWLIAMTVLIGCSAFFSASEAALFYLRPSDRHKLRDGNRSQRAAAGLLSDSERLLSAILFWNLVINISYFAIASIAGLQLERNESVSETGAVIFTLTALLSIILFSEMVPKSLGVVSARPLAGLVGLPLSVSVRVIDPIMPVLQLVNLLSRRLIWPGFEPEPYLEVADLERAIKMSTTDAELVEQEEAVLQNIITLSEIRADELMRPRTQFVSFEPPVSLADLGGKMTPSEYLMITEAASDEVAMSVHLTTLSELPNDKMDRLAEPVIYIPWFVTAAVALQQLQARGREVAAVVNELGETIGVLTYEDILDTVFTIGRTRSARLQKREAIQEKSAGVWLVNGMTTLRRLQRYFEVDLPECRGVTVTGITHEVLERLPVVGDRYDWGPFHFCVTEVPERGQMTVELTRRKTEANA